MDEEDDALVKDSMEGPVHMMRSKHAFTAEQRAQIAQAIPPHLLEPFFRMAPPTVVPRLTNTDRYEVGVLANDIATSQAGAASLSHVEPSRRPFLAYRMALAKVKEKDRGSGGGGGRRGMGAPHHSSPTSKKSAAAADDDADGWSPYRLDDEGLRCVRGDAGLTLRGPDPFPLSHAAACSSRSARRWPSAPPPVNHP